MSLWPSASDTTLGLVPAASLQGGEGVAQVVEADGRQAGRAQQRPEVAGGDVAAVKRLAGGVAEEGHIGGHGDFQWHTGPQAEPDDFYAGNANATEVNRRDVAGVGAPVVNQSLCKNGRTGFQDCGTVIQLNVCNGAACSLVQMDARRAAGGDSGGSVYWGNTAYGFHQGWRFDPFFPFDRDLFSRADRIDDALGVNVVNF